MVDFHMHLQLQQVIGLIKQSLIIIIIIWEANHPYSQLTAELQRIRLRVQEAGMQGRLWLPATSTSYDHGAQPEIESV